MQSADLGWNDNITNLLMPAIRKQSPSDKLHIYEKFSEESNLQIEVCEYDKGRKFTSITKMQKKMR